ncbi:MAG: hypothetical protein BGO47_12070 [Microbacterium sp. 67-17]|uniref:ABC transporter permease n=1 Tax=Microbacterium sp. 67-17 TaxID=1895782 RepID=UPI000968E438|nr:ABC transporter permease [Microbacterium sp. 67-17]OJW02439.1 MAG: hypothetical protein BGO47_12070 [Microbacterium sp. 67-17]
MTALTMTAGSRARRVATDLLSTYGIFIALAVVLIVAAIIAPNLFYPVNIGNTLRRAAILGLLAMAQILVLMVRGLDLSVAAMMGLTAVAVSRISDPVAAVAFAFAAALLVGSINAALVVVRKVPAFLATFGMALVIGGVQLIWTRGAFSADSPDYLVEFSRSSIGGIPFTAILWIAVTIVATLWLRRTVSGRQLVMSGANPRMAELSGVRTGRLVWIAFVVASSLAVVAGLLQTGYASYIDRTIGVGMELDSITAALLAGASFRGGEGSFIAAVGGVLLLSVLFTLLIVLGLPPEVQGIVNGAVLIFALVLRWPGKR